MSETFPSTNTGNQLESVFQHYVIAPLSEEISTEMDNLHRKVVGSTDSNVEQLLSSESNDLRREIRSVYEKINSKLTEIQESTDDCGIGLMRVGADLENQKSATAEFIDQANKKTATQLNSVEEKTAKQLAVVEEKTKIQFEQLTEKLTSEFAQIQQNASEVTGSLSDQINIFCNEERDGRNEFAERILTKQEQDKEVIINCVKDIQNMQERSRQDLLEQIEVQNIKQQDIFNQLNSFEKDNKTLRKLLCTSMAISGSILVATIVSILLQLLR